uniref:Uncharacterized protein n=1 Tax=Pipistrellus kuhlii TaxID=59472 RepID=A0A7J7W2Y2_PIPKU|nr:hypothetical protein mPipKuh1_008136 [Pipistrellus kuhlii]
METFLFQGQAPCKAPKQNEPHPHKPVRASAVPSLLSRLPCGIAALLPPAGSSLRGRQGQGTCGPWVVYVSCLSCSTAANHYAGWGGSDQMIPTRGLTGGWGGVVGPAAEEPRHSEWRSVPFLEPAPFPPNLTSVHTAQFTEHFHSPFSSSPLGPAKDRGSHHRLFTFGD